MRAAEGSITPQDLYTPSTTQNHSLGARLALIDGRVFRYAQAGTVDLVAGTLLQAAPPVAFHLALTPPIVAAGATSFLVTPGATAGAANLYAEGYLNVDTGPGNGVAPYRISGHPAITASVAFPLSLDDPIAVALTAGSRIGLFANLYKNVIAAPVTKTGAIVGVAPTAVVAGWYAWVQTWGPASVLINGAPAVTAPVVNGGTAPGSVDVWTAAAQATSSNVGEMMQLGVTGKNNMVYLKVAP